MVLGVRIYYVKYIGIMYKSSYDVINILELWVVYLENCYKVIIKIFNFLCIV